MSFEAMTWAIKQTLPAKEKLVLLLLGNRCNPDTGQCNPSHARLAKDCGLGKTALLSAIKSLESGGYLTIIRKKVGDVNLSNQYQLKINTSSTPNEPGSTPNELGGSPLGEPKTQSFETQIEPFFSSLSEEEKNCYEWAKNEPFWQNKITTAAKFKKHYLNGSIKTQFENWQAKKNQCNAGNANTGLNQSTQNGGNYEPRNQQNANNRATGGKLSAVDRVRVANGMPTQREENELRRQQQQQQERVIN